MGHASGSKIDIRRFLKDCGACGASKGYLHLPGQDHSVRVTCRCESSQCPRCGRQLLIAPISTVANDLGGLNWEFSQMRIRCASCGPMYA